MRQTRSRTTSEADALHAQGDSLGEQLQALEEGLLTYSPGIRAMAGVIVTVNRDGGAVIHRGLLREVEAKALRMLEQAGHGSDSDSSDRDVTRAADTAHLSEKLVRQLSGHRTVALQVELARKPRIALAALVHGMVQRVLQDGSSTALALGITVRPQNQLEGYAADMPQSPAAIAWQELQQSCGKDLPDDAEELFTVLLAMEQDTLLRLLAVCVASTVDAVTSDAHGDRAALLARAVGLDMRAWWTPTAEGYFRHVTKAVILADAQQFAPEHAARLAKLSKADCASEAERLVAGTGWMPAMLRASSGADASAA